jgi:hypothetical protein
VYVGNDGLVRSVDDAGVVTIYSPGITQEQVEDYVGGLMTSTASVQFTYNDAGNQLTATVLPAGVDHNALANFVANKHIDHSAVSISGGTGLTGGGDITASRTISMPNVGVAGTYGAAGSVPVFTTDAQGRVSAVTPTAITPGAIGAQPLDSDLTAIAALAGTGLIVRTATGTATTRSVDAGTGLSVTNGDGISGNPTLSMPNVGTPGTYGTSGSVPVFTTDAQGRVSGVAPTQINHTGLLNIGTNTHAQIDSHIASTSNPHSVTAAQVGNTAAQWNANQLQSVAVASTAPTNGYILTYNGSLTRWEPQLAPVSVTTNNYSANSTTTTTTTSTTDVILTGMVITTPPAGTYLVSFDTSTLNSTNGAQRNWFSLYVGGVENLNSERAVGTAGGAYANMSFSIIVAVNGSQDLDVRWRVAGGTGTALARCLSAVRIV